MSNIEAVNLHGELRSFEALANSLVIAEKLGIDHWLVLRKIRDLKSNNPDGISRHKFVVSDYKNSRGKTYEMYELDEVAAMWVISSFSSKKSDAIRLEVIEGFYRLSNWIKDRGTVADAHNDNKAALMELRLEIGKCVTGEHWDHVCKNESKLVNGVMTGQYSSNPRNNMSPEETDILISLYKQETAMIQMGLSDYAVRKALLLKWYSKQGHSQFEIVLPEVRAPREARRLPFAVVD